MNSLPETPEEIEDFIRAVESGEIETPPVNDAKILTRMVLIRHELERLKKFIREEVLDEIHNQNGKNTKMINKLRSMVSGVSSSFEK